MLNFFKKEKRNQVAKPILCTPQSTRGSNSFSMGLHARCEQPLRSRMRSRAESLHQRSVATRGRNSTAVASSASSFTSVEEMHGLKVGFEDCGKRLQASVRHSTSQIQWPDIFPDSRALNRDPCGGNIIPVTQGGHTGSSTGAAPKRLLLQVFLGQKEGGERHPPYPGSESTEFVSQEIQVPNAHTLSTDPVDPSRRLVYVHRPERCLFPHINLPASQEISEISVPRRGVRIHSTPIRSLTESESICEMYTGGSGSTQRAGHSPSHIPGRLAPSGTNRGGGCQSHRDCALSSLRPGACCEHGQECFTTQSENSVSGTDLGFGLLRSTPLPGKGACVQGHAGSFHSRKRGLIQSVSQAAGSYGIGASCGQTGPLVYAGFPALGLCAQTGSSASQDVHGQSVCSVRSRSPSLEAERYPDRRCQFGHSDNQESGNNRCQPHGLGRCIRGQPCKWCLEPSLALPAHKLLGAYGGDAYSKAFSANASGTPRVGEDRQHFHCGTYKSPRRVAFSSPARTHAQAASMVQRASALFKSDTRTRHSEYRSRSPLQGQSLVWRMAFAPECGGPNLDKVRPRSSGLICVNREHALSSLLLPARSSCDSRSGCSGSRMASHAPLRVSSPSVDSSNSPQGEAMPSVSHTDSPALAIHAMAGGGETTTTREPVAPPVTQGSVDPSGRADISSSPGAPRSSSLAPEWLSLTTAGLPQNVIHTIQSARAASTRSLYDRKWKIFEAWCIKEGVFPFNCSLSVVLSFLQNLIDKGRAFSTVKVYLAAISACHIGFNGKTLGQHPLICRFMKGARRLLPVSRPISPSWDLSVVLQALTEHPFEPLGGIEMKMLSLKTVLLLALTTAKRVSDIHALSVHSSCMRFSPDNLRVSLRPNPAFIPKVVGACSQAELDAFQPPPHTSSEEQRLHNLCPVRALSSYVERTRSFRQGDQLFVSWAKPHRGRPVSKQRLSHWIVEAISTAYSSAGLQVPVGLRAHSTRGLATSWAYFRGVSIQDICAAASWSSPLTFARFYRLDVTSRGLSHSVLSVGSEDMS